MKNNTLTLAGKYRPQCFEDIVEQDSIKVILENQIKTNNLKHAYLFCGSAGCGKTTSARIIANHMNEGKAPPIELDCASHNSVDDVRVIINECKSKPMVGKYKIFLMDEVHVLTVQAWSAMLKILEEPPEYVIFLFCTTDPQKIIGTILSRVQRFNFSRISIEGITNRLVYIINSENKERLQANELQITYEDNAINYIARLAKGGMRDAITTLEKCLDYSNELTLDNVLTVTSGSVTEPMLLELLADILNGHCDKALLLFERIYMSGVDVSLFLKLWVEYLQNCTKYMITQTQEITTLSDISVNRLNKALQLTPKVRNLLEEALQIKNVYSTDDLKILIESWLIQVCSL